METDEQKRDGRRSIDPDRGRPAAGVLSDSDARRFAEWALERTASRESVRTQIDLRPSEAPRRLPRAAPRYELRGLVGRGGMGEVSLAWDSALEREVAVKSLLDPADEVLSRRFVEEARVTGKLAHPNIVPDHELELDPAKGGPIS